MHRVSKVSPYVESTEESPWVVWRNQASVFVLPERHDIADQSACASPYEDDTFSQPEAMPVSPAKPIQRMQYNAVLKRISNAVQNTHNYSSWTT